MELKPYKNILGMEFSEKEFLEFHRIFPDFFMTPSGGKPRYDLIRQKRKKGTVLSFEEEEWLILCGIFGAFDEPQDLLGSEALTKDIMNRLLNSHPTYDPHNETPIFLEWLRAFASAHFLLGLTYGLQHDFVKSAYHLMNGIKCRAVNIDGSLCDFINFVICQLDSYDAPLYQGSECGFSAEKPMGSSGGPFLDSASSEYLISELEGFDGGATTCFPRQRGGHFGYLKRLGSTSAAHIPEMIDIYETYYITKDYRLYTLRLFVNGYYGHESKTYLPNGFGIHWRSELVRNRQYSLF